MTALTLLLIFLGPFLVVAPGALIAAREFDWALLVRPMPRPPQRPVTRPRPARAARWAVI